MKDKGGDDAVDASRGAHRAPQNVVCDETILQNRRGCGAQTGANVKWNESRHSNGINECSTKTIRYNHIQTHVPEVHVRKITSEQSVKVLLSYMLV